MRYSISFIKCVFLSVQKTIELGLRYFAIGLFMADIIMSACQPNHSSAPSTSSVEIKTEYYPNEKVASKIAYENGEMNGPAFMYRKNGKLNYKLTYKNGLKQGEEIRYYEDESIYRVRPYVNGNLTGIEKRYYRNGNVMTEQEYKDGMPGTYLKEYYRNGNEVTGYPRLILQARHIPNMGNEILVTASLSEPVKNVTFYVGELIEDKYLPGYLIPITKENGKGLVILASSYSGKKVHVIAKILTERRGIYLTREAIVLP